MATNKPWWECAPKVDVPCPARPTFFVLFAQYDMGFKFPTASSRVASVIPCPVCPTDGGTPVVPICFKADLTKAKLYTGTSGPGDSFLTTGFTATPDLIEIDRSVVVDTLTLFDPYANTGSVPFSVSMEFPQNYFYVVDMFFTTDGEFTAGIPNSNYVPSSNHWKETILRPVQFDPNIVDNTTSYIMDASANPSSIASMDQNGYWDAPVVGDILGGSYMIKTHILVNSPIDRQMLHRHYVNGELVLIETFHRNYDFSVSLPLLGEKVVLRLNTDLGIAGPISLANVEFCQLGNSPDVVIREEVIPEVALDGYVDFSFVIEPEDKMVFLTLSGSDGDADLYVNPGSVTSSNPTASQWFSYNIGTAEHIVLRDKFKVADDGAYKCYVYGFAATTNMTLKIIKVKG